MFNVYNVVFFFIGVGPAVADSTEDCCTSPRAWSIHIINDTHSFD